MVTINGVALTLCVCACVCVPVLCLQSIRVCVCVRANVCVVRACFTPQRLRSSTRGGCWLSPASAWRCWWSASSAWWPTAKPSTCLKASKWTPVMGEGGNEWIRRIFTSLESVGGHVTPVKWKCKIVKREIYDTKRATRTHTEDQTRGFWSEHACGTHREPLFIMHVHTSPGFVGVVLRRPLLEDALWSLPVSD